MRRRMIMMWIPVLVACSIEPAPEHSTPAQVPEVGRAQRLCMQPFAPATDPETRVTDTDCTWGELELPLDRGLACRPETGCAPACESSRECHGISVYLAQTYYAGRLPIGITPMCVEGQCRWRVE